MASSQVQLARASDPKQEMENDLRIRHGCPPSRAANAMCAPVTGPALASFGSCLYLPLLQMSNNMDIFGRNI